MRILTCRVQLLFALAALVAAVAPMPVAAQGRAVALVVDVEGATAPVVEPYSELNDRTKVMLTSGAKMSFVHYGTCRLVAIQGGQLYIDRKRYSVAGGKVVSEEKTDCPREQKLALAGSGASVAAGVVMRGAGGSPHLGAHPRIVVTGAKGARFTAAELRRAGKALGAMSVTGHMVSWPADKPALEPGGDYTAHLMSADGKSTVDFQFSVAAPGAPGEAAAILRLD